MKTYSSKRYEIVFFFFFFECFSQVTQRTVTVKAQIKTKKNKKRTKTKSIDDIA